MAARQRETAHELDDGFVVAWDSSEIDEKLRKKLARLADEQLNVVVGEIAGDPAPQAPKPRRRHARGAA
jgi:hypothetical protein